MAKKGKTIQVVAMVMDETSGEIEDTHSTRVTGQTDATVDKWKQGFAAFGKQMVAAGTTAGVPKEQMHMHRAKSKHGAWPK